MKTKQLIPAVLLLLALVGVSILSVALTNPPAPLPANTPADQFSAQRALVHVQAISGQAHPVGSAAHAEVQAYIRQELAALGLESQVQAVFSRRFGVGAQVENIVARLPGSGQTGKAVLLVGHYDSVSTGPGASDNASAVATLLETARALKYGGPLSNDVIFLFSDGEELGLLGAAAYVNEHPWAKETGLVLNFEARGRTGPVYTFETSTNNAWLMDEYAKANPYPVTNSLMYEAYRQLPNDTDYTVFKNAGYPGLNFAFIGEMTYYHSPLDTPANMDLGSLQQEGTTAVSLTRHFGNLDLTTTSAENAVYFNTLGKRMVVYPQCWNLPLVILSGLAFLAVLGYGLRKRQVSIGKTLLGMLAFLITVLISAAAVYFLVSGLYGIYPQYRILGAPYNSLLYLYATTGLVVAIGSALQAALRNLLGMANLALGAAATWLALAAICLGNMPGAAFLVTWPLLFGLIGLAVALALQNEAGGEDKRKWLRLLALALLAVPGLLLVMPSYYMMSVALGMTMLVVPGVILALLLGLLAPQLDQIARPAWWGLPLAGSLVAIAFLAAGHFTSRFDASRPQSNLILYGLDAEQNQAYWIGFSNPDGWTSQFLGTEGPSRAIDQFFPEAQGQFPVAPAPVIEQAGPQVKVLDVDPQSGNFRLQVIPSVKASVESIYVLDKGQTVQYTISGHTFEIENSLEYWQPPTQGYELILSIPGSSSIDLRLVDRIFGLPEIPGFSYQPRPPEYVMWNHRMSDSTLISRVFHVE